MGGVGLEGDLSGSVPMIPLTPIALIALLACAHLPPSAPLEPVVITGSAASADVSGLTNREIVERAIERRLRGDTEGAIARLNLVLEQTPPSPETADALYQLGLCHEREERFAEALASYDRLVTEWPEAAAAKDGWFRRALCLEYLDRHREARRSLARIEAAGGFDLHDRLTLDLQRSISMVRSGRLRQGLRLMDSAMAAAEGTDMVTYLRAKAHTTRARVLLEDAGSQGMSGSQRRQERALKERAALLAAAEQQVAAAAYLQEPEWILEGLLLLGQAYQALHQDLLSSSPPRGLSQEGVELYREELTERSRVLLVKAWNHFDTGVAKAGEWRYVGRPLPELIAARDAIDLGAHASSP
jgi:tetratricopeptide (TPR) repeat protein